MSKRIVIELQELAGFNPLTGSYWEYDSEHTRLYKDEYPNVYLDKKPTDDELDHAIDVIVTDMLYRQGRIYYIDLDRRNEALAPVKEMTLEEIEKELGHKVKVVNKDEDII